MKVALYGEPGVFAQVNVDALAPALGEFGDLDALLAEPEFRWERRDGVLAVSLTGRAARQFPPALVRAFGVKTFGPDGAYEAAPEDLAVWRTVLERVRVRAAATAVVLQNIGEGPINRQMRRAMVARARKRHPK